MNRNIMDRDMYLINSIESLNKIIEHPPHKNINFFYKKHYRFSNIGIKMEQYYSYFSLEGFEDEFEKLPIDFRDYNPKDKKHSIRFDLEGFIDDVGIDLIKRDMIDTINSYKANYINLIDKSLLSCNTDLHIQHFLNEQLKQFQNTFNLKFTDNLTILQSSYLEILNASLQTTYNYLTGKYSKYITVIVNFNNENNVLEKIIFSDELDRFNKIESNLIKQEWVEYVDGSYKWNKSKVDLVDFCRALEKQKITRPNLKVTNVIRFFEKRYNESTGDSIKPNKFNKRKLEESKFLSLFP